MDIALQACQLTADSPNRAGESKTCSVSGKKGFGEYLESIRNIKEEPATDKKSQEIDALLMQLLSLLNMNISVQDFKAMVSEQLSNPDINPESIDFSMGFSTAEMQSCWQEILSEFNTNGSINQDTVKMFYLAMKKAVPDMADIDLEVLQNQINKMLEKSNPEAGQTEGPQVHHDGSEQHNPAAFKAAAQTEIKDDEIEEPENRRLKQHTEDDSFGDRDAVRTQSKEIRSESDAAYNKSQGDKTMPLDNDASRYRDVSSFSVKESFAAPSDKVDSNIVTLSAKSNNTQEIFEQLVDKMHLALKGDVQQVSIRLKPDSLGDVLIKVFADKDNLKAELFVDNTQVRTMLKVHAFDFQNQIREQGYNISEISVYKMSDGLEMGASNQQSGSSNHYQARKSRMGFSKQAAEDSESLIRGYYDLWGNSSNVNYMA